MATSPILGADEKMPAAADDLQQELRRELEADERLLWSGFPCQGVMFRGQDILMIPFSLMWGGFAIFWEATAVIDNTPLFFKLWGIPFVLVGLWLIAGRFFTEAWSRARTVYGVSSRRVLIISGLFRRQTRSLELLGLSEINISERPDGSGTITFGPNPGLMSLTMPRGWPGSSQYLSPAFEGIARAREVLQIIRNAQRAAASNRV